LPDVEEIVNAKQQEEVVDEKQHGEVVNEKQQEGSGVREATERSSA